MAKKQKPYFLTLDEQREFRREGVGRPRRRAMQKHKAATVEKEGTKLIAARIAESVYNRFAFAINYPDIEDRTRLPRALESAIECWLVDRTLDSRQIAIFYSKRQEANARRVLAELSRKRRGVRRESLSYRKHPSKGAFIVNLPKPRGREGNRRLVQAIIKVADEGLQVLASWDSSNTSRLPIKI